MKRWKWVLLIFELALFAVILVMPQVELPDFTFHGGTAPILAKARLSSRPLAWGPIASAQTWLPGQIVESHPGLQQDGTPAFAGSDSRLSLLCALIC
jgi:hypothetical protein